MKKAFISILAVLMAVVLVSCSNQGKTVDTTGVNETTETTVKTEETTITEATESTEETTVVTTESTTETTETTKAAEEEIQGECKGVWRAEKVTVSPEGSSKDMSYDVSEELISVFLDDNGIYIGSTDSIKQQYSRYGDCTFNEDKSGKTVTISMFSLATGNSLKVTYYYRMYKDMWGTIKLELVMDSIKGDATVFGFNSFMNEQHTIV
ncbi:MAG: hypothetical protein K6F14_08395, partial [Clostridiales bacterium]|nr:hypothetical protein [Clostridiales bacterium]